MSVSGGPVGANTSTLSEIVQVVKENSAIMKDNSEIMKRSLGVLIRIEKRENREPKLPSSVTRAKVYRSIVFEQVQHNYFLAETNSHLGALPNSVSTYIQNNQMTQKMTEKQVQNWFKNVMTRLSSNWNNKMVFRETNDTPYLDGYKPDISIFNVDDIPNDAFNTVVVQTILELKKHKRTIGFSDEEKGQLVDYLHILIEQQPLRRFFAIFLSDGTYLYVIAFDRNTSQYQEYQTDFITGLRLFHTLIYRNSGYVKICGPTSIDFVIPATSSRTRTIKIRLERFLGEGSSSKVYRINWNGSPTTIKIISDVNNLKHEAQMLRGLKNRNFTNVPILIANDDNHLVIQPVCKQFRNDFINNFQAQHCKELLNLLKRTHSFGLYHRDVRPSNIMLDTGNNSLVLVDWGSAVYNPDNMTVPYKGTTTYASPSILDNDMGNYVPKPADDLHSFVRTMYVLRNPQKKPDLASSSVQAIKDYWNNELNGRALWREMTNADNNRVDLLEKICDIFEI
ncbi:kinase-like domain-containing protein [Glomus cerebriforme]|uniref:Kinase-like domain-containing protein n=1 Tax=Glomus cerebriforme TaxID=658196 RepID=A0A397SAF4_9GLOM|nr:kinase-like domain-containing protein [Glomus cerebriforme]